MRLVVVGGQIWLVDVGRGQSLRGRVGWRKVGLRLKRIALWRIALDLRRRRVLRGGTLVLRRVAIGHLRRVGRLSLWRGGLVRVTAGVVRGSHQLCRWSRRLNLCNSSDPYGTSPLGRHVSVTSVFPRNSPWASGMASENMQYICRCIHVAESTLFAVTVV